MPVSERHRATVRTAAISAGAAGVPGAFSGGIDAAAMTGIWGAMTLVIAEDSGHEVDAVFAAKLATGLAAGAAAYIGGSRIAVMVLHSIPGAGTLGAIGVNSFLNFWFTYRVGNALSALFDREGFGMQDVGELTVYLMTLITPMPSGGELSDMYSIATDTSLHKPELFQLFEQARRA